MDEVDRCRVCLQDVDSSWAGGAVAFGEDDADWLCAKCFNDKNFTGLSDTEIACAFYEAGMCEKSPHSKQHYFGVSLQYARLPDALAALANITSDAGEARKLVDEALGIDSEHCWAVGLYTLLLASEGKFDEALEFWQSHRLCFPEIVYDFEVARLLRALGHDSEALLSLDKALDACNTEYERQMNLLVWERGDCWGWPSS